MTDAIAVFVDGENISADHAARIRDIAAGLGTISVLRVYGNANTQPRWSETPGFRFVHSGTGKNATDILLTVQAMEAALSGSFTAVVIASSDRDFTHLVTRIREIGITVVGVGETKAPEQFHAACTRFVTVPNVVAKAAPRTSQPAAETNGEGLDAGFSILDLKIRDAIKAGSKNGQGILITQLAPAMYSAHGTRISTFPERTWRGYLKNRPMLYDLDAKGQEAKVRFKPAGFAAKV